MVAERVCAYCRKRAVDERWKPFCSERCKLLDLAAWAEGTYRIAGEPVSDPEVPTESPDGPDR